MNTRESPKLTAALDAAYGLGREARPMNAGLNPGSTQLPVPGSQIGANRASQAAGEEGRPA
jgi:hypothetical protein